MSWRVVSAIFVLSASLTVSAQALCASVSSLPQDQGRAAQCMAAALSSIPEATRVHMQISDLGGRHIFLKYDFKHHCCGQYVSHEKVDITEIVSHPGRDHGMALGGLLYPKETLDDADAGMSRIAKLWRSQCHLKLWPSFV